MKKWSKIIFLIACVVGLVCMVQAANYPTGKPGANPSRQQSSEDDGAMNDRDLPPLFDAVLKREFGTVRALVEKGANVNQSVNGATPLCFAIEHPDITRYLIEKGADVNVPFSVTDPKGWIRALVSGCWIASPDILALALRHGLTRSSANTMWSTFFEMLPGFADRSKAEATYMASMRLLLDKGADVNAKLSEGATPIMMAVRVESVPITRMLIDRGADVNAKDDEGTSVLTIAKRSNKSPHPLIDMLRQAGARQ